MKKHFCLFLVITSLTASVKEGVSAHPSQGNLQHAVETSLRLPVAFDDEPARVYSVNERLSFNKVPGVSFALIDNGKLAWAKGYGKLASGDDNNVTSETLFQAGSIAKPVTAYAVMRMKDKGKIDIKQDIENYLTALNLPKGKQTEDTTVTWQNILDHSSGLTGGGYKGYAKGEKIPTDVQTFLGLPPASNGPVKVENAPGNAVLYSGGGYTLVEIALRDFLNQPFEQIMDGWALHEMGMHHSSFRMDYPSYTDTTTALGHDNKGATIAGGWRIHPEQAAAGLWSTPTDIAKFAIEMMDAYQGNSQLLSRDSAREMLSPVMPDSDLSEQFGGQPAMTFIVSGEQNEFRFQHGGGTEGYRSLMVVYPETGDGAVFMTNSDSGFSVGLELLRAAADVYNWPDMRVKRYARRAVDKTEQTNFHGNYIFDAGWHVDVRQSIDASGIELVFPNGDIYPLSAVAGDNTYVNENSGTEVSFKMSTGKSEILLYNQTGRKP